MPKNVEIPEVGVVEFPDDISDQQVSQIANRLHLDAMNKKPISQRGMTGETGPEASLRTAGKALVKYPGAVVDMVLGGPAAGYRVLKAGADKGVVGFVNQLGSEAKGAAEGLVQTGADILSGDVERSSSAAANLAAGATVPAAIEYGPKVAGAVTSKLPRALQVVRHPVRSLVNAGIDAALERMGTPPNVPKAPMSGVEAMRAVANANKGTPLGASQAVQAVKLVQGGMAPEQAIAQIRGGSAAPPQASAPPVEAPTAPQGTMAPGAGYTQVSDPAAGGGYVAPEAAAAPTAVEQAIEGRSVAAPPPTADPMERIYQTTRDKLATQMKPASPGEFLRSVRKVAMDAGVGLTPDEQAAVLKWGNTVTPTEAVERVVAARKLNASGPFKNLPTNAEVEANKTFPKGMRGKAK